MSESMKIGHLFPIKSTPLQLDKSDKSSMSQAGRPVSTEFRDLLESKVLKFSHHAETRMEQRGIKLQPESLSQIMKAVDDAASKGAKDSLIVYRDIAMIVNVPSRTVVTALDGNQMKSNVFTQIDSAIILN
ncbi:TIGR02530 family flagellar biosynthesis protein [Paenibacillus sp. LHD-117]|uniref:TIGR02530 family flagellar biosynthesis protein n=1 Tax=Paenibacillus sp. LHD-117 TaxID=3071412 RepID=UPI0027E1176B|nr:TIGR02530 family flagellar biosynthesis protein [Paenibacillus sp. LHD-117]MDQ6419253.1 TIGR02530 family flagellar biosynthesis protein [Paenibacillus sp. LHD-117]